MEYLGHIVSAEGVSADPNKLEAMSSWPAPRDIKGLRGFLGLTGCYRRFVKGYGLIAKPLTELLKKDKFNWSLEAEKAFTMLKTATTSVPVLAVPDFAKPFVVETNASSKGLGAVLLQEGRPVAYLSQSLSNRAQQRSIYERELMAIVMAVQKWRHYLLGQHFIIRTDQKSLKFLTEQRVMGEDQFKWTSKLMGFDFEIQYKPGSSNKAADALSRQMMYASIPGINLAEWEAWEKEIAADPKLLKLIQAVVLQPQAYPEYNTQQGRLFHKGSLLLPRNLAKIPTILAEFHASPMGGHSGFFRTYKRIAVFQWEGMTKDIRNFIAQCTICQQNKYESLAPVGLLQPLPVPTQVWADISMDFIGELPRAQGKDTILVVVDRLTKYAQF